MNLSESLFNPLKPKIFIRDMCLLFTLALLVRLLAAFPQQQPNYMDAAYSYVNALNLAAGYGFVENFVWNYLDNPAPPPHPSHLYWMPLTSILAWLGMAVGGPSYRAAQIAFIILSALLAPISYWVAWAVSGQRRPSWLVGLLAIFSGFYFPFWTAIDNFTPFAIAGSLSLLMAWQGMTNHQRQSTNSNRQKTKGQEPEARNEAQIKIQNPKPVLSVVEGSKIQNLLAGVFVGLSHLARADGPLLLITIILTYLLRLIFHPPPYPP